MKTRDAILRTISNIRNAKINNHTNIAQWYYKLNKLWPLREKLNERGER